jgi:hypothetical protein
MAETTVAKCDKSMCFEVGVRLRSYGHLYYYKWMEELAVYYYDAFCQVCDDYVLTSPGKEADMFADIHNASCC